MSPHLPRTQLFSAGVLCGMLLMVAANGLNWFIAYATQDVSSTRYAIAIAQVAVSLIGAGLLYRRARSTLPDHSAAA